MVQSSGKDVAVGHWETRILALALPQLAEGPWTSAFAPGLPCLTHKAKGVKLDGGVSYDFFWL